MGTEVVGAGLMFKLQLFILRSGLNSSQEEERNDWTFRPRELEMNSIVVQHTTVVGSFLPRLSTLHTKQPYLYMSDAKA